MVTLRGVDFHVKQPGAAPAATDTGSDHVMNTSGYIHLHGVQGYAPGLERHLNAVANKLPDVPGCITECPQDHHPILAWFVPADRDATDTCLKILEYVHSSGYLTPANHAAALEQLKPQAQQPAHVYAVRTPPSGLDIV